MVEMMFWDFLTLVQKTCSFLPGLWWHLSERPDCHVKSVKIQRLSCFEDAQSWDRLGAGERETGPEESWGLQTLGSSQLRPSESLSTMSFAPWPTGLWAKYVIFFLIRHIIWGFAFYLTIIKHPPLFSGDPIAILWSGLGLVLPQFIRNVVLSLNCIAWQFILASSPMKWSLSPCIYQWILRQFNESQADWTYTLVPISSAQLKNILVVTRVNEKLLPK